MTEYKSSTKICVKLTVCRYVASISMQCDRIIKALINDSI